MKLSIIIPAYNEEDNIGPLINKSLMFLSGLNIDSEIIVVDDGSLDNTSSILQNLQKKDSRIHLFKHCANRGLGAALLTGFQQAKGEFITWIPADAQICPSELNKLLEVIDSCDIVVAKYIRRPDSWIRRVNSAIWHFLLRLILQYQADFNGNYMFKKGLFKDLDLKATTGLMNFELIYKASLKGYTVKNVYISCSLRTSGESKVWNIQTVIKTFWEMFKIRFSEPRNDKNEMIARVEETKKSYGFLWMRNKYLPPSDRRHFNVMQRVIGEPIVRGEKGIDIGSGCGYDTYLMAKNNPAIEIVSMDLSDGVYKAKELACAVRNVQVIKGSILDAPFKSDTFDFAYSFGVLHHTFNPQKGLFEIARILRSNSPVFLYLYEDHSENPLKYLAVELITKLRKLTVGVHPRIIHFLSWICSPLMFIVFSLPAKMLARFRATRNLAAKIPFNFGTSLFSLQGDLFDRFRTPIEYRFSRKMVYDLLQGCGFRDIKVARIDDTAGWVAWGYKI